MNTITENDVTFKDLERDIFDFICEMGRQMTQSLLEGYDKTLMKERDKAKYRHKGKRTTTVKTLYGEVLYSRAIYYTETETGETQTVYLLDEALGLDGIGLFSENMKEQIIKGITELSYRECATKISEMTGQNISHQGIWNALQVLGEQVCEEEKELVKAHKAGKLSGELESPVLFEEIDGVYINMQGKDRKAGRGRKSEMKVAIAYDGWKEVGTKRYSLSNKVIFAGFSKAKDFHECREAVIAQHYNLDETQVRLLNGDGAGWIKKVRDKSTHFQLDPFHKYQAITKLVPYKKAAAQIREYLDKGRLDEMFYYLEVYKNSLIEDNEITKAEKLITYFRENEEGLIPYQEREIELPKSPKGLQYRGMGTMENHIRSIIARRMKHNQTSWSKKGGNNLAKILAKKCSGRLEELLNRAEYPVVKTEILEMLKEEVLSVNKSGGGKGKGYRYPVSGHFVRLDGPLRGNRRTLLALAGF